MTGSPEHNYPRPVGRNTGAVANHGTHESCRGSQIALLISRERDACWTLESIFTSCLGTFKSVRQAYVIFTAGHVTFQGQSKKMTKFRQNRGCSETNTGISKTLV